MVAMPEGSIQVTSHQSLVPSHSSLFSNFRVSLWGVSPSDCVRKRESGFYRFRGFGGGGAAQKKSEAPRRFEMSDFLVS